MVVCGLCLDHTVNLSYVKAVVFVLMSMFVYATVQRCVLSVILLDFWFVFSAAAVQMSLLAWFISSDKLVCMQYTKTTLLVRDYTCTSKAVIMVALSTIALVVRVHFSFAITSTILNCLHGCEQLVLICCLN